MGLESTNETKNQENSSNFPKIQEQKIEVKTDPKIYKDQNKIKDQENKIQPPKRNNPKKYEISKRGILDNPSYIPLELVFETKKSICKIIIQDT